MHPEPKAKLRECVQQGLLLLQPLVKQYSTTVFVWKTSGKGQWRGTWEPAPDARAAIRSVNNELIEIGAPFTDCFFSRHPEYDDLVGFDRTGRMNLGHFHPHIFQSALSHLWWEHQTFELDQDSIDSLADSFEQFVDRPTIPFQFSSQLINFSMECESIALPGGLHVRRMTEKEIGVFNSGYVDFMVSSAGMRRINEFCIEGVTEELKAFGELEIGGANERDPVKESLDNAILCLRTFKAGHVGYDYVHFYPQLFCPLPLPAYGYGDMYVPLGSYNLANEESALFAEHAKLIVEVGDGPMIIALSRLADAETRTKPYDRLIDAVIGMEALLLAPQSERFGELSFRFSLHYSMLYDTPEERQRTFKVARDFYKHRSSFAHGSKLGGESFRLGDEKLTLDQLATRATDALRYVVKYFLPNTKQRPYAKEEFWQRRYLG